MLPPLRGFILIFIAHHGLTPVANCFRRSAAYEGSYMLQMQFIFTPTA